VNSLPDSALDLSVPMPQMPVETPCFVVIEESVKHNLQRTAALAGGVGRMVPHVKTHRSPWVTRYLVANGVKAFKTATTREIEMVLDAGSPEVIWSYPTTSEAGIARAIAAADAHPKARITGVVDDATGLAIWVKLLANGKHPNVDLRIDVDPGLGRTGVPIGERAIELALAVSKAGLFAGWHIYDGHIQDLDLSVREDRFLQVLMKLNEMFKQTEAAGLKTDIVGGGSYTFPFWAKHTEARVSPGSWVYTNSQHQADQPHRGWKVGAYVLSRVVSDHEGTLTLDAGSKAVSPDMPMERRFVSSGVSKIVKMNEEHTLAIAPKLHTGDLVALVPRHTCTTAYLYRKALVLTEGGEWEYREQLGCER
jgi:3-hydroxy-D-aspartate aldolase